MLSTQNVVPDDGGSARSDVVSSAPTIASANPAIVVSWSPRVTSGAGRSVDVTTFSGLTIESGSFCQADAWTLPETRPAIVKASAVDSNLLSISITMFRGYGLACDGYGL